MEENPSSLWLDAPLENLSFLEGSYFDHLMDVNLDYMFSLDPERLLFNYRRIAGLDTKGALSYGGWISPTSNGAGQFEAMYLSALARYCRSKPNYQGPDGSTPLSRLRYLLSEIRKCQLAFGKKYPEEAGFLSAISLENFKVIRTGKNELSDGTKAWVPYYFLHKSLMGCLDSYLYCPDEEVKKLADQMIADACHWLEKEIGSMSPEERDHVLAFEFGGMSEVLYRIYRLEKDKKVLKCAEFFEQKPFLDELYANHNVLANIHANTTIPKILGCAAAYEVTGKAYYRTIAENFFEMVLKMDYANGGVSFNERFEEEGHTSEGNYSEETCCSYNLLKLTDYLYRWSGESRYSDYIENTLLNHILCSMDPDSGGKTYPVPTAFGAYKVYSAKEDTFWCCCCTGMESFSKLTMGEFYLGKRTSEIALNLFEPMTYRINSRLSLTVSGDLYLEGKIRLTVQGPDTFALLLRHPAWCVNPKIRLMGKAINPEEKNGSFLIERTWKDGDFLEYELPMDYRLEPLKGKEGTYALFYGPLLLVAGLGEEDVKDIQKDPLCFGNAYSGEKTSQLIFKDSSYRKAIHKKRVGDHLVFEVQAENQTLRFIPFIDCHHERYAMYLDYVFGEQK